MKIILKKTSVEEVIDIITSETVDEISQENQQKQEEIQNDVSQISAFQPLNDEKEIIIIEVKEDKQQEIPADQIVVSQKPKRTRKKAN